MPATVAIVEVAFGNNFLYRFVCFAERGRKRHHFDLRPGRFERFFDSPCKIHDFAVQFRLALPRHVAMRLRVVPDFVTRVGQSRKTGRIPLQPIAHVSDKKSHFNTRKFFEDGFQVVYLVLERIVESKTHRPHVAVPRHRLDRTGPNESETKAHQRKNRGNRIILVHKTILNLSSHNIAIHEGLFSAKIPYQNKF